jgi:superfamily I DNA/RNA helicase
MLGANKTSKYSGPPGTGKSTTLLGVVERLLGSGIDPEHIVFTTFTRAGANEARERACARFNLPEKRLPYFRTLHSLCYQFLPRLEVMGPGDWGAIAHTLGLSFSSLNLSTEADTLIWTSNQHKGDYFLYHWHLARLRMEDPRKTWETRDTLVNGGANFFVEEFLHFIATIAAYKKEFSKVDYTDLLERWLIEGQDIHCDYVIIDEAQDLSPLQWKVIERVCVHAKHVWVAGDDDQCIYTWSGASPSHFINLPAAEYTVLPQSYRIPAGVHRLAQSIIQQVKERLPKDYLPRADPGRVERIASMDALDLSQGTWLLLARNGCFLPQYHTLCQKKGYLFDDGKKSDRSSILAGIKTWKALASNPVPVGEIKNLYKYMSQRDRVRRGFKMRLLAEKDDRMISYEELKKDFGLLPRRDMPWHMALDMVSDDTIALLQTAERRPGGLEDYNRIRISTIHGSKGQEADHVVILPSLTAKTYKAWTSSRPDDEHRVFYVGVTRAKQSLYVLPAQNEQAYPL